MKLVRITLILLLSLTLSLSVFASGRGGARKRHAPQPNTRHQLSVLCQGLALMEFQVIPCARTVLIETEGVR
jgi:hypothetical protein